MQMTSRASICPKNGDSHCLFQQSAAMSPAALLELCSLSGAHSEQGWKPAEALESTLLSWAPLGRVHDARNSMRMHYVDTCEH